MQPLINKIIPHIPVLQVMTPMCAVFLSAIFRNPKKAASIALLSSLLTLILSLILIIPLSDNGFINYALGNWHPPVGIEYKIDYLNLPLILLINTTFFLFFLLGERMLESQVLSHTPSKNIWIVYALLLLSQIGLLGISSTADLFNLYVFIEIASLAAYALFSLGKDKRAVIGAFNYLVLGTIGATFILIGIGLILAVTGSLNMRDIKLLSVDLYKNKAFMLGIAFYITGSLLKVALIPMHSWMVQAYNYSSSVIIAQLSGISNFVGFYIIIRFIYGVLEYKIIYNHFHIGLLFETIGLLSIIIGSLLAVLEKSLKKILIFSSLANIGYISLALSIPGVQTLQIAIIYLIVEVTLKTALFLSVGILEDLMGSTQLKNISGISRPYPMFTLFLCLNLIMNAALPPSMPFFNKLVLMQTFVNQGHIFTLIVMIIASLLGLFYNYRIIGTIYFEDYKEHADFIKPKQIVRSSKLLFYFFSTLSIIIIFFYSALSHYIKLITKVIL